MYGFGDLSAEKAKRSGGWRRIYREPVKSEREYGLGMDRL